MKATAAIFLVCFTSILAISGANAAPMRAGYEASPYRLQTPKLASPLPAQSSNVYKLHLDNSARLQPQTSATMMELGDKPYAKEIEEAANAAKMDPRLVHAVVAVESGYRSQARSPKGAVGLMQVLPETGKRVGVSNPGKSVSENLKAGTRYLQKLQTMFDGRLDLALAAYNAGENSVIRHKNTIPPYGETQHYVPAVLAKYAALKASSTTSPSILSANHYKLSMDKIASFRLQ